MKKLLICLLTLTMVLAMGATSVFADETGSMDFGGLTESHKTWNGEEDTQDINLEVQLTDSGADSGFTTAARDEADANPNYRVLVQWKKTAGTGTVNYQYYWNVVTKKYVASDIKTATVETHPTLGVTITNYSNAKIKYKINLKEGHKFQSVLGELKVPSWAQMTSFEVLNSAAVDSNGDKLTTLTATGTEQSKQYGSYVSEATAENTTFYVEEGSLTKDSVKQTVGTVTVTISKVVER